MNILFFIGYLGFVTLFFFLHLPKSYQLSANILLQRNPHWLRNHPDVLSKVRYRKLATRMSYLMGIALVALLGFAVVKGGSLNALTSVYLLAVVVVAIASQVEIRSVYRFNKLIPPPDAREADLLRKELGDYVPIRFVYVTVAILALFLVGYVYAYSSEVIPYHLAVGRIGGIIVILLLAAHGYQSLFRRPAYHGVPSGIKQIESYMLVIALCLAVLVVLWRIANDFFGTFLFPSTYVFFGSSIALQFAPFLYLLRDDVRRLVEQKPDDILNT